MLVTTTKPQKSADLGDACLLPEVGCGFKRPELGEDYANHSPPCQGCIVTGPTRWTSPHCDIFRIKTTESEKILQNLK